MERATKSFRLTILWIHRWSGLITAIPLLIASITGAVLVWHDSLDEWLNASMMVVKLGDERLPLQRIVRAAEEATGGRAMAIANPRRDDRAIGVAIGPSMIFVDPYTASVLGKRLRGTGFVDSLQKFHVMLLSGDAGRWISAFGAIGGVFMGLTGLWLWWPIQVWYVHRGKSWLRLHFDLHAVAGFYFLALTLLMSWTAVHMSFSNTIDDWMVRLLGGKQAEMVRPSKAQTANNLSVEGSRSITPDQVAEIAQTQFPEARIRFIQLSAGAKQPFRVQLKYPEDGTAGGRTVALIDPRGGQIRGFQDSRDATGGPWLNQYVDAIHTGEIGGWPLRIAYAVACVAIVVQVVTGVSLWWLRRTRRVMKNA